MNIKIVPNKNERYDFDSWGEFLDFVQSVKIPPDTYSSDMGSEGFTGTKTFKDAFSLGLSGWNEPVKDIEKISAPIFDDISKLIEREDFKHDTEGIAIDIASFVNNEPECWLNIEKTATEKPIISIVFNSGINHSITPEQIKNKGAIVVSLVKLLEFSGYRVKLVVASISESRKNNSHKQELYIVVKNPDQPLDMARITFALCHPSFTRRLIFRARESSFYRGHYGIGNHGGYGHVGQLGDTDRGDINIPGDVQYYTKEEIEKWIKTEIEKFGVKFKEEV